MGPEPKTLPKPEMLTLVTGGTGLVGQALLPHLRSSLVVGRGKAAKTPLPEGARFATWNPSAGPPTQALLEGIDAVVHLAGEPVGEFRWTKEKKESIRDSRVTGTRNLVSGLAAMKRPPKVLVSASAVGFYGDCGDEELRESARAGDSFLAEVCASWEKEALNARDLGVRVVCLRIGIVLSDKGGALDKMLPIFRKGLGGKLGSGKQWMPWVHLDDVVGLVLHSLCNESVSGPLNLVAPHPVRNSHFTKVLGKVLSRPAFVPVPAFALGVAVGEMSKVVLASQRVLPTVAIDSGYEFVYPKLHPALESLV